MNRTDTLRADLIRQTKENIINNAERLAHECILTVETRCGRNSYTNSAYELLDSLKATESDLESSG